MFFYLFLSFGFLDFASAQEGASKPGGRRNIRFLKAAYIKDLTFLRYGDDPLDSKKCFIDLAVLQGREEAALRYYSFRVFLLRVTFALVFIV